MSALAPRPAACPAAARSALHPDLPCTAPAACWRSGWQQKRSAWQSRTMPALEAVTLTSDFSEQDAVHCGNCHAIGNGAESLYPGPGLTAMHQTKVWIEQDVREAVAA